MELALEMFLIKGLPSDPTEASNIAAAKQHLRPAKELLASCDGDFELAKLAIRLYDKEYKDKGADYDWWLKPVINAVPRFKASGKLSTSGISQDPHSSVYNPASIHQKVKFLEGMPWPDDRAIPSFKEPLTRVEGRLWTIRGLNAYTEWRNRLPSMDEMRRAKPSDFFGEKGATN